MVIFDVVLCDLDYVGISEVMILFVDEIGEDGVCVVLVFVFWVYWLVSCDFVGSSKWNIVFLWLVSIVILLLCLVVMFVMMVRFRLVFLLFGLLWVVKNGLKSWVRCFFVMFVLLFVIFS